MKDIPLFETFILILVGLEGIVLVSFDIFSPQYEIYGLMSTIMPQGGWGLLCFLALFCQAIGLLSNVRIFRYIGLALSGGFFTCLFFINMFDFPNLMSGITLTIAVFCFVSCFFVKDTDLIQRDKSMSSDTEERQS